jgi:hypothetical protein
VDKALNECISSELKFFLILIEDRKNRMSEAMVS